MLRFLSSGARSALLVGAIVTLWSFLRVNRAMGNASDATGFGYVAVAFGLVTTLALTWSVGVALALSLVSRVIEGKPRRRTVFAGIGGALSVAAIGAGFWSSTIPGIDPTAVAMTLVIGLGVPAVTVAQWRVTTRSILWTYGVPIAGSVAALLCFVGAASWASSSATMREAVTRMSALVKVETYALRRLADGDGDGFAALYGGADCDDTSAEIHPMAREVSGNDVDEDCSGSAAP